MAVTAGNRIAAAVQWTAGTDHPTRAQFNALNAAIDAGMVIYSEGPLSGLPGSPVDGQVYFASDTYSLYYFTTPGGWYTVGRTTVSSRLVTADTSTVATGYLDRWNDSSGNELMSVGATGRLDSPKRRALTALPFVTALGISWWGAPYAHPGWRMGPDGLVMVQGTINTNGASNTYLTTTATGALPAPADSSQHQFNLYISGSSVPQTVAVQVMSDGRLYINQYTSGASAGIPGSALSLDGISYYAA